MLPVRVSGALLSWEAWGFSEAAGADSDCGHVNGESVREAWGCPAWPRGLIPPVRACLGDCTRLRRNLQPP